MTRDEFYELFDDDTEFGIEIMTQVAELQADEQRRAEEAGYEERDVPYLDAP